MPDTSSSQSSNPAVLRFRGLDLEAMTALQMRNINAVRRMAKLMFDGTQTIAARQAAFFKASAEQMGGAFEGEGGLSDPKAIFERQTEAYRDLFGALATHAGELADITSKCCAGLMEEATGNMTDLPMREGGAAQPAEKAGCCCGSSKEAAATLANVPAEEGHAIAGCCAAPGKESPTENTANHPSAEALENQR